MNTTNRSLRVNEAAGLVVVGLLMLVSIGWAARTEIAGAVVAGGAIAVKDNSKDVQHVDGGIIREIYVSEGSDVEAGTLLVRLDDTQIKAKLGIIEGQLIELGAEQARLEAERDGVDAIGEFAASEEYAAPGTLRRALEGQRGQFVSNRQMLAKKREQLREQMTQVESGTAGSEAKLAATEKQMELARAELGVLQSLMERGLTTRNRIFAMEREIAQLTGQADDLRSTVAAQRGRLAEVQLKLLELDDQRRSDVMERLSEVRTKLGDLHEQRNFELFRLRGTKITAPISGKVHNLRVHTADGVATAGSVLMTIVPVDETIVFRARVRPSDIDRLYIGQSARLRLTSFNSRITPEIPGIVTVVGADQSIDSATGEAFFRVDVEVLPEALAGLAHMKIKPGLPAEAFITTSEQTVMTYLFKPLFDQFARAFRET